MGVLYSFTTCTDFISAANPAWLESIGFVDPPPSPMGHNPSADDLRAVLDSLAGYRVTYQIDEWSWSAEIVATSPPESAECTSVNIIDFEGDASEPKRGFFEKGSVALILTIMERLSWVCGPLVIATDIDAAPLLVTPGLDLLLARRRWDDVSQRIERLTRAR